MDEYQAFKHLHPQYSRILADCYQTAFQAGTAPNPQEPLHNVFETEARRREVLAIRAVGYGAVIGLGVYLRWMRYIWSKNRTILRNARVVVLVSVPYIAVNYLFLWRPDFDEILHRLGFKYEKELRERCPTLSNFPPSWESKSS